MSNDSNSNDAPVTTSAGALALAVLATAQVQSDGSIAVDAALLAAAQAAANGGK